jgi:hypothetical protein
MYLWVRETYSPGDVHMDEEEVQKKRGDPGAAAGGGSFSAPLPLLSAQEKQRISRSVPADVTSALAAAFEAVSSCLDSRAMVSGVEKAASDVGLRLSPSTITILSSKGSSATGGGKKLQADKRAVDAAKEEAANAVEAVGDSVH